MVTKDQILLVLGVHEGRRFPKRQNFLVYIEAKFDGELLSTDPVTHIENPDFSTELAWELNKKTLHQHRLQRTPVKVECFAVDKISSKKESIGYCILDQRSAQLGAQKAEWHPLLSSKYKKLRPEVKIALSLEEDVKSKALSPAPLADITVASEGHSPKQSLVPALNDVEGYYVIHGTDDETEKSIFVMSVTLASARNLVKLIPSGHQLKEQEGFYFYYSLVGNDVMSEPFYDLINPSFPAERASVRIFANEATLSEYIRSNPTLEVHLCAGEEFLGSARISLLALLSKDLFEQKRPSVIEGFFSLTHPTSPNAILDEQVDNEAVIGTTILLKFEGIDIADIAENGAEQIITSGGLGTKKMEVNVELPKSTTVTEDIPLAGKHLERKERIANDLEEHINQKSKDSQRKAKASKIHAAGGMQVSPKSTHHYCYSIDLRTIKDLQVANSVNAYCRYTYPFFGSAAPIMTHPPVEIRRNTEVLLPHSFCAFDFATLPEVLLETLRRVPLMVEVWHRDTMSKDYMLGTAEVNLSKVMDAASQQDDELSGRKIIGDIVPIFSSERKKIGILHAVLGMEDLGEVSAKLPGDAPDSTQSLYSISTDTDGRKKQEAPAPTVESQPRFLPEYTAALELEMWKEHQEEMFMATLQQKESEYMKNLAEEWKRRDKEREMIMKRKVDEYSNLEETLRKSIVDLERREKQLSQREADMLRLKADLSRQHEQSLAEVRDATKRAQESCDHQISLERTKNKEITAENQRLKEQLKQVEKRLKEKENEFLAYKEQQLSHPEVKLQAELNLVLLEKTELERKLESVTKSKIHYKQQWGRALRELAKFKQTEQMAARTRLKQQEKELEQMRLRYLANEEKEAVKTEKDQLKEVRQELERLKIQGLQPLPTNEEQPHVDMRRGQEIEAARKTVEIENSRNVLHDNRVAKLIEERDTLLQTGVYTTDDRIIAELDRQIRELIAKMP